jgi:hypothetical protein
MSSQNEHCNADHLDRPASCNPNPVSVIYSWDLPNDDLDMFSRWIRLSDEALAGNRNATRKVGNCGPRYSVASWRSFELDPASGRHSRQRIATELA